MATKLDDFFDHPSAKTGTAFALYLIMFPYISEKRRIPWIPVALHLFQNPKITKNPEWNLPSIRRQRSRTTCTVGKTSSFLTNAHYRRLALLENNFSPYRDQKKKCPEVGQIGPLSRSHPIEITSLRTTCIFSNIHWPKQDPGK